MWGTGTVSYFGEGTPAYLFEVVIRVAIVYLLVLIAMRFLGKRMVAEVGRADIVARVSLAAAVGLLKQRPGRGLLVAILFVVIIVVVGRLIARWVFNKPLIESRFQGKYAQLVSDGMLDHQQMQHIRITRERLFAALRSENIRHLGQVERFYMEANRKFSLVEREQPEPGLSVIPDWDDDLRAREKHCSHTVCFSCGLD